LVTVFQFAGPSSRLEASVRTNEPHWGAFKIPVRAPLIEKPFPSRSLRRQGDKEGAVGVKGF